MICPSIPSNENSRLRELLSLEILNTNPEDEYDKITELASHICGVPISLISLIGKDRQFFKSTYGINAKETPRDLAFCAHTINYPTEIFEVPNASIDYRFHDHPMVTGKPNFIFYAGIPLVSLQGHALGSLCVIDHKPNKLDEFQKKALKTLSFQVSKSLELRKNKLELEIRKEKLKERKFTLTELAHLISHDLKSPINNIIGLSEVLYDSDPPSPELSRKLSKLISLSAYKLKDLIDAVLTYAASENLPEEIHIGTFYQNTKRPQSKL
ncbi:hypothetical protein G3O08_01125 [Cryomorpha ignava]|uniref:histidine kinase n=1 Tax=Cryomorpha ignava TaxID=101383 RepID=A0A7K3WN29_9FLAO|nr:GAF domain-containing protein [Cryomorpha ignava]NEN22105.1 hypothetical protein [Cryomorpha ignava]